MSRGHCGIGIYRGKTEENIGTLFRSAHAFGADWIFTVGRRYRKQASDTSKAWRHIPLFHFASLADLRDHLPFDTQIVGVELAPHARPLPAVAHPERVVYLLGAEDHGLPQELIAKLRLVIQIPGAERCLNVATAGSIVLYDRAMKRAARKAA